MKTIWKWVLGIGLVLVAVAAIGFAARGFNVSHAVRFADSDNLPNPIHADAQRNDKRGHGFDYERFRGLKNDFNHRMPRHGNRGFAGFGFGGFLHTLFPLGVLVLVAYVAYQQGMRIGAAEALISARKPKPKKSK